MSEPEIRSTGEIRVAAGMEPSPAAPDREAITTEERSQLQMVVRRFLRHRLAVVSLIGLLLIVLFAFVGPLLWQYDHHLDRSIPSDTPPSLAHPFGTTRAGHDFLGQVMRGTQQSLKVGAVVALMVSGFGSVYGAIAGFYRGRVDAIMMRLVDIILVIPLLAAVLVLSSMLRGTTWWHVAVIIGAFGWTSTARVVRGVVLSLREQEFIEAARAMGASDASIIGRHLLPNTIGVIIVDATLVVAVAILVEAALSFIGFGITIPDVSLGLLIQNAQTVVFVRPWLFYIPGFFIIMICLTINFIGDGLRDALDPKQSMVRR
jgi:peptide/nickel transport system permease protein